MTMPHSTRAVAGVAVVASPATRCSAGGWHARTMPAEASAIDEQSRRMECIMAVNHILTPQYEVMNHAALIFPRRRVAFADRGLCNRPSTRRHGAADGSVRKRQPDRAGWIRTARDSGRAD